LEQASRLVGMGEMAANLAHDVGNGLNSILNYTQGADRRHERGTLTLEQCHECFEEIRHQAHYMRDILMMIQQFVKTRFTERIPIQLPEVIKQSELLLRGKLLQRSVQIHFDDPAGIPTVLADPAQITLVVVNLMLNAAQAMANSDLDQRLITVSLHNDNSDFVEVSLRDRGPGIPSDLKEKIFEKFYTTKKEGLGLGLACSRAYVEQHGGKLWCETVSSTGCDFRFTLPCFETE
jgi:signal transduction histidine kinase